MHRSRNCLVRRGFSYCCNLLERFYFAVCLLLLSSYSASPVFLLAVVGAMMQPVMMGTAHQMVAPQNFVTGLCDCCTDVGSCLDTVFCSYCQLGRQKHMLSRNAQGIDFIWCCGPLFLDFWLWGLAFAGATAILRGEVRRRYGLTGESDCESWLIGCCCAPLSLCQTYREMSARGAWPGGVCASVPFSIPGMNLSAPVMMNMVSPAPMMVVASPQQNPYAVQHNPYAAQHNPYAPQYASPQPMGYPGAPISGSPMYNPQPQTGMMVYPQAQYKM